MKSQLLAAVLCAFVESIPAAAQTAATAPAQPVLPPVEAFGTLPLLSSPALSPDGKYLALIQARNGRPVTGIWALESPGSPATIIPYEGGFISGLRWANAHRLLVRINLNQRVIGQEVEPFYRTISYDVETKDGVVLFATQKELRDVNASASNVIDVALNEADYIYMSMYSPGQQLAGVWYPPYSTLFRVNINTGLGRATASGSQSTIAWFMDGDGKVVAREDLTYRPLTDHILAYTSSGWHEIGSVDASKGQGYDIYGVSADGKGLVIRTVTEGGTEGLGKMSLEDGKITPLFSEPLFDVTSGLQDAWTGRVVGASYISHMAKSTYFDPQLQEVQAKLEGNFPGRSVSIQAWDTAMNKFVFSVDGSMAPTTYNLYERAANKLTRLGQSYPKLTPSDLGETRVYDYPASDGLKIPAYLTVPPRKQAKNLPVVILPHGGPRSRDDMNFNWEAQFLANRGYAVLQPNFRGSSGYGRSFEEAGYGQWGLKMQDDITDGVKKLITDGIADPKRICIVGGSYGGYAALAGAMLTPDLYACAAAWAPVTDLREMLESKSIEAGGTESWFVSATTRFIGDRWNDAKKLDSASPARNADKITVPVLLMHGEADSTVRIAQSEIMERALKRAKKNVTFIRIPGETHNMKTAQSRILWLTELEKFLAQNIGK